MEGAYILSNENVLLYSAGEALPNPEEIRVLHNGDALYASSEQFGYAIMFMDIEDASGFTVTEHVLQLYGYCKDCAHKQENKK